MPPEPFAAALKRLRLAAGMTMQDLADASGVSKQVVHNCEAGKSRPTWDVVQSLASALGVSTDVFRDKG
jgi:transcriptional regulator with XRE-family HTH domain